VLTAFKLRFPARADVLAGGALDRLADLSRWLYAVAALARWTVYFQNWALWLVAALAAAWLARRAAAHGAARIGFAAGLTLLAALAVCVASPHPIDWQVKTTLDRLLFQVWPACTFALCCALPADTDSLKRVHQPDVRSS
jgi:hypothetical protein